MGKVSIPVGNIQTRLRHSPKTATGSAKTAPDGYAMDTRGGCFEVCPYRKLQLWTTL
ncbi:uncharacterized protein G2W53_036334 [Senna tora]|uniref:Uncharacterized protein n=1 Tax=Senna tora TaxID=362788 RepID=A0A834STS4_9FABA|nr:uncharacterized protein G2W53_036334 [Senna tora]